MMTRLIQRTAFRLLSAGVFSFCSLTLVSPLAAAVDPGKVRMEAIKVELALLSDSSAYAQPLSVRVQGDGVEVQGTVASEAIRQRVLEIARRSCYLPIHDKIAVAGAVSRATAPLVKAAHDRLVHELGAQADAVRIQSESGKLKLTGQVRSLEDKLHASRTLRGLPGCGGLINNLEVKAETGPSFTLITHADEEPQLAPAAQTPSVTEVAPRQAARPAPVATLPSGLPPTRVVAVQVDSLCKGKDQSHTVLYVVPPVSGGAIRPAGAQVAPVAETPLALVAPLAALALAQDPTPSPAVWPPAHRTMPASTPSPAGTLYQSHPLSYLTRPQAVAKPVPESRPAEVKPVAATTPVAKKPVVPAPAARELIRKVKAASGSYARDVRVETGADGFLAVHVYATPGGEQMLTTKLFDVPELTQSSVRLHIHLAP
jgi:osmotically-inducible protein OsmY